MYIEINNMKKVCFFCLFYFLFIFSHSQNNNQIHNINIQLDSVKYNKIEALFGDYQVEGISDDKHNWLFVVPDSIFTTYKFINFNAFIGEDDSTRYRISFGIKLDVAPFETSSNVFFFTDVSNTFIKAYFKERIKYENSDGQISYRDEYIVEEGDPEFFNSLLMVEDYLFGLRNLSPEQAVENYLIILKKYPNTRSALTLSQINISSFSKGALEKVYHTLVPEIQQSYYGKITHDYLLRLSAFSAFDNIRLPDCKTANLEEVISDPSKHTLVIFSASWCGPCIKEIPLLKETYQLLHNKLNMVYISIDDKETVDNWRKLMEKENILWRSLLAVDNVEGISDKYFVTGIPMSYLIYPDGKFEEIKMNDELDKQNLYNFLINNWLSTY